MPKKIPEGTTLAYYAEPNIKDEKFTGPFPAKVIAYFDPQKPETEPRVDLLVMFSRARAHSKTGVLVVASARKHCATLPPDGFTYDNWYDKLDEKEKAAKDAESKKASGEAEAHAKSLKALESESKLRHESALQRLEEENKRIAVEAEEKLKQDAARAEVTERLAAVEPKPEATEAKD